MRQCGRCISNPPPLDGALAAVSYAYPWSGLIVRFKFQEDTAWARSMATLLRSTPWVEPALDAADWLIPMPLSVERMGERGFNQSLLLARALDHDKTRVKILLRIQHSAAQSSLSRKERVRNLQSAFAIEPEHYAAVRGKRCVVVDDVMTTGSTVHAAARVLRAAGAASVTALVFARTE
jgi:ComF family protein